MKQKFVLVVLVLTLLLLPIYCFAGDNINTNLSNSNSSSTAVGVGVGGIQNNSNTAVSNSKSNSNSTAIASGGQGGEGGTGIGIGGTGIGVGGNASSNAAGGNANSSIGNLSATTGPASANISLNQKFEASTIPRELIQGPGFVIPSVMNNFGPFTDTSWNIFPIGVGKTAYSLKEAQALLGKGKGIQSHSKALTTEYAPTKKIVITDKLPAKGEVVGNIIVRGEDSDNDTNEVLGRALLDGMQMGATQLVILRNGANIENKASSGGIGVSNTLSIIAGGAGRIADAATGGTGFTKARVGQRFYPYVQAVAVRDGAGPPIPGEPIKPDIKISPQTKLLEKREKEQTVTITTP